MNVIKTQVTSEKGVALVFALILVLILAALATAMISAAHTDGLTGANYRLETEARFTAEAGAQAAANFLKWTVPTVTSTSGLNVSVFPLTDTSGNAVVICSVSSGSICAADSTVSGNFPPDTTQQTAFNTRISNINAGTVSGVTLSSRASIAVMARLMSLQPAADGSGYLLTWQITSLGSVAWVRPVQVQVVETFQGQNYPVFGYAAYATSATCGALRFSGGTPGTDSYDSSTGSTPAAAWTASHQNTGGDIGTNGNLNVSSSTLYGTYSSPKSGTGSCSSGSPNALTTSSSTISGGTVHLSAPVAFTAPPAPTPAPPTTNQQISSSCPAGMTGCHPVDLTSNPKVFSLDPGTYGNFTVSGGTEVRLICNTASSPCTYNVNRINISSSRLRIMGGGKVVINVAGSGTTQPIVFSGGNSLINDGVPSNFQLQYAGTSAVALTGGGSAAGVVNTPNAPVTLSGGSDWYGAIVGSTITDTGGTTIHFDRNLKNDDATKGNWHVGSFTWSKY